ncbi:hypothetical protein F5B20DRAFT_365513 [Whalleya microplaca]|nr:hypothetical protein F5B20DRAFT_365513 [Whalleya microplaca]
MDPLSALSLAGNIVQFVDFASKLCHNTQQIYRSCSGQSATVEHLDGIYDRLLDFDKLLRVQTEARDGASITTTVSEHYGAIEPLLDGCRLECDKLLEITLKIKAKEGSKGRRWESFRKAMHEVWRTEDISRLQIRLRDYQTEIIIRLCAISKENTEQSIERVQRLTSELSLLRNDRMEQLSQLDRSLQDLSNQVKLVTTRICKPDGEQITRGCTHEEFEILTTRVSQLSLTEQRIAQEETILTSLNFDQRPVRHEAIPEAHTRTFRWILGQGTLASSSPAHGFTKWLQDGDGVYWISGKPGSGKSTLMKFIAQHIQTMSHLSSWSGSGRLVVASHFFWSAGFPVQRSREGLLRSLLYDILSRVPELIPNCCEQRWRQSKQKVFMEKQWSLFELQDVLRSIVTQEEFPMKFCFFIDGLDEFEGDSFDICHTLLDLCASPHVKMCISSRPWNVFETYLGQSKENKLYVQDLTGDDIRNYVESELRYHPKWNVSSASGVEVAELVNEVTNRAEGVFLWVFLVTRMLREGLMNDDSLSDLRARLDRIPNDLEKFFKHILESVDPFYHEKQSGTLQIALAANGPLSLHIYSFHDLEYTNEDYALGRAGHAISQQELYKFHGPTSRRLNARCQGLLETRRQEVEFLHRTVRDFLRTREMSDYLKGRTKETFNPSLSLLRAHIAIMKSRLLNPNYWKAVSEPGTSYYTMLMHILECAQSVEEQGKRYQRACFELLDDLDLFMQTMALTGQLPPIFRGLDNNDPDATRFIQSIFRSCVLDKDLACFVASKLEKDPGYFDSLEKGPLLMVLGTYTDHFSSYSIFYKYDRMGRPGSSPKSTRLLQFLLEDGYSPNQILILSPSNGFTTPWTEFMSRVVDLTCSKSLIYDLPEPVEACFLHALTSGVFSILLRHGANPNDRIPNWRGMTTADTAPTIGTIWIYLGLKSKSVWKYGEFYLRDLKAMVAARADFGDLRLEEAFELRVEELTDTENMINDMNRQIFGDRDGSKKFDRELAKWKEIIEAEKLKDERERRRKTYMHSIRRTRWEMLTEDLRDNRIPEKQLFKARVIIELAKADKENSLPWAELEPSLRSFFPSSISQMILREIRGGEVSQA